MRKATALRLSEVREEVTMHWIFRYEAHRCARQNLLICPAAATPERRRPPVNQAKRRRARSGVESVRREVASLRFTQRDNSELA